MLESMRTLSRTPVTKTLFLLLVASFALWGIGDVFRGRGGIGRYVAKVGDEKLSSLEFNESVKRESMRFQKLFNAQQVPESVTTAVMNSVLQQMVNQSILSQEVKSLGVRTTDEAIKKRIAEDPAFQENGKFSAKLFKLVLQQNRLNEGRYIAMLKHDMATSLLLDGITSATAPVQKQAALIYQYDNESRKISVITLPRSAAPAAPAPKDEDINSYYEKHKNEYVTEEYRAFSYITFSVSDMKDKAAISDTDISDYYQNNKDQYVDASGQPKPLEKVKDEISKELLANKMQDGFYKFSSQIEDALAGGATLDEIAKKYNLKVTSIASADKEGMSENNSKVANFPTEKTIVETAFGSNPSDNPSLTLLPDQSYLAVKVDNVTSPRTMALNEVKDRVVKSWQAEWQSDELKKLAGKVHDALAAGKKPTEVAAQFSLPAPKNYSIKRDPKDAPKELSQSLLDDVFVQAVAAPSTVFENDNGEMQIAVTESVDMPKAPNTAAMLPISAKLEKDFYDDVMFYYGKYVRSRYSIDSYLPAQGTDSK